MLNGDAISWKSKRQSTVSLSSAESEYITASHCSQEVIYLREILRGFNCAQDEPTVIFEDNQACIAMSENQVHRERSGHTNARPGVRKYFVRDLVDDKVLQLIYCKMNQMVADALTKSLPYSSFSIHRGKMTGTVQMNGVFLAKSGRSL